MSDAVEGGRQGKPVLNVLASPLSDLLCCPSGTVFALQGSMCN